LIRIVDESMDFYKCFAKYDCLVQGLATFFNKRAILLISVARKWA